MFNLINIYWGPTMWETIKVQLCREPNPLDSSRIPSHSFSEIHSTELVQLSICKQSFMWHLIFLKIYRFTNLVVNLPDQQNWTKLFLKFAGYKGKSCTYLLGKKRLSNLEVYKIKTESSSLTTWSKLLFYSRPLCFSFSLFYIWNEICSFFFPTQNYIMTVLHTEHLTSEIKTSHHVHSIIFLIVTSHIQLLFNRVLFKISFDCGNCPKTLKEGLQSQNTFI